MDYYLNMTWSYIILKTRQQWCDFHSSMLSASSTAELWRFRSHRRLVLSDSKMLSSLALLKAVEHFIQRDPELQEVILTECPSHEMISRVCYALYRNDCSATKNIRFELHGAQHLALPSLSSLNNVLRTDSRISHLSLSRANLVGKEAENFANALKVNHTITHLDLSMNHFDNESFAKLARALAVNTTISFLDLSSNRLGANDAKSLACALQENSTLSALRLLYNPIGHPGYSALLKVVSTHNTTLTKFEVSDNLLPWRCCPMQVAAHQAPLREALKRNQALTDFQKWLNKYQESKSRASSSYTLLVLALSRLNRQDSSEQLVFTFLQNQFHEILPFLDNSYD